MENDDAVVARAVVEIPQLWNARQWDAIGQMVSDDHRFVDHRAASAGEIGGRRGLRDYLSTLVDVVPDAQYSFPRVHRSGPGGAVAQWRIEGTNDGGGPVELEGVLVVEIREGLIVRSDQYALEQLDDALARFYEIEAGV